MTALNGLDTTVELTRHAVALRAQGYDFAMRYYSNNAAKNLSLGEARALSQAGLKMGVVWETTGTHAAYFTRAQGLADGAQAFRMAQESIGQPFGSATGDQAAGRRGRIGTWRRDWSTWRNS
jgi:hypothetical protein